MVTSKISPLKIKVKTKIRPVKIPTMSKMVMKILTLPFKNLNSTKVRIMKIMMMLIVILTK